MVELASAGAEPEVIATKATPEGRSGGRTWGRGAPLLATWARWSAASVAIAAALAAVVDAYATLSHSGRTLESFLGPAAAAFAVLAALLWVALRAEELRLARELRIARTGTPALRATVTQRQKPAPALARLVSTKLGRAAVSLADGDRADALDACAGGSPVMRGGRLEELRAVVDADLERSSGTFAGLDLCVKRLRAMPPIGNREADLYRVHVLAKALLECGDASGALELARQLEASGDDEERLYRVWLRVWFDLDATADVADGSWAPLSEGEVRMAMLLARAHGAEKLVEKLEGRVAAIARPMDGE